MVADKVTKMDAKMVIKSIFREQNVQLELVAGGCADDNVISRLVGEVVDVVGMVADRQVVEEEVDMLEQQVTKVDTNMYKDREQNLGSKLLSVMIILFLEVVREVIGVFQQVMDMQVNKMKDQEVHKLKDKVSREVAKMYKDLEFSVRADGWEKKKVFSKVIGEMIHVVQVVMNMQMDKVEDYKVFKEEEQVTREVAKVDKDMVGSRIWGNVG